jgi:diguanylate cyclase
VGLSFIAPYRVSIHLLVPLGLFACLFEILVGIIAWLKQVASARYYVIAWLMFLSGGVILALNKLNLLPTNFFTEYSMQFGSVFEAVLLSFALAERINIERKLRFAAQDEALQITRRLNLELEQRVQERTSELELLNTKLQELSNTDQLTQLKNRRYMDQLIRKEWSRCKRYGHFLSVMILDVDFFKNVNDQYGHSAGDTCLKQIAKRMLDCLRRPSDQVARYGGEEFCIILPETDSKGAQLVAERIRKKISSQTITTEDAQFSVTVSIGIESEIPLDQTSVETMLHRADLALYHSKQNGRNLVTLFRDDWHDNGTFKSLLRSD